MAKRLTQEEFIEKCDAVHNKYDHSRTIYYNNRTKIAVICKDHGEFFIYPSHYLRGKGCLKCGHDSAKSKMSHSTEGFIEKSKEIHGDTYDYSKVKYKNSQTKVIIICKEHGEFAVKPNKHIHSARGCPICGKLSSIDKSRSKRTSNDDFIDKCIRVHGDTYDYSITKYDNTFINNTKKVSIICKKHGEFVQIAYDHLDGHGCPKCPKNTNTSVGHAEILEFLDNINVKYSSNDRTAISPQELDIYVESLNVAIEFNGVYWHSKYNKNYHYNKYKLCADNNISLYQFWDIDWKKKRDIIKSIIMSKCKKIQIKLDARKCTIKDLDIKTYKSFLIDNHIQGYCYSEIRSGLYFNNELVSVIGFNKNVLNRYCQKVYTSVRGGISKLLKYCIKNNNFGKIYTFSDNMYSNGNVYKAIGFKEEKYLRPDYKYFNGKDIIRKEHFRKKRISKYDWYDSSLSESQNMLNAGNRKIYDAGKIKWVIN